MVSSIFRFIRRKMFTLLCRKSSKAYGKGLRINHWCRFSKKTVIGDNCNFNGIKITGNGNVVIGDNFHSGGGVLFLTSNHNYDSGCKIPYDESTIDGDIFIGDNVWLGQNVTILQGVTIGEGAIVQAGSVVVSDVLPLSIVGGHPARMFKMRDRDHYYRLKNDGKFF